MGGRQGIGRVIMCGIWDNFLHILHLVTTVRILHGLSVARSSYFFFITAHLATWYS